MYDDQQFWRIALLSLRLGAAGGSAPTLLLTIVAIIKAINVLVMEFALIFFTLILGIITGLVVGAFVSTLFGTLSKVLDSQRITIYNWGQFVVPALFFIISFLLQIVAVYPWLGIILDTELGLLPYGSQKLHLAHSSHF